MQYQSILDEVLSDPLNLSTKEELEIQLKQCLNMFIEFDKDKSGYLSIDEIHNLTKHLGFPIDDDDEEFLIRLDKDDSGSLEQSEWVTFWMKRISRLPNPIKQQEVIAINTFKKFDVDLSGFISKNEFNALVQSLGLDLSDNELFEAIKILDIDNSGNISKEEFTDWWNDKISASRTQNSLLANKLKVIASKAK